jgi:hypothetical protein
MPGTIVRPTRGVLALWVLIVCILCIVSSREQWGWDIVPGQNAAHALSQGEDVYRSDASAQQAFQARINKAPGASAPYMFVYPPITLVLLRWIGAIRVPHKAFLLLAACILAFNAQTCVTSQALVGRERLYLIYLAPVTLFFPGLLANDNILSGNIAYILYGVVLLAAHLGWKRQQWTTFYVAVLAASCFKTPYLTLLAIPLLSSSSEWRQTVATAMLGLSIFFGQAIVWPSLFLHYLASLAMMFGRQHDFGSSPAGLLATASDSFGATSSTVFLMFYCIYAIPLFCLLFYLSRKYLDGVFTLEQWIPVLLLGVILLNPRIIEYDVAPITLPLVILGWRFLRSFDVPRTANYVFAFVVFLAYNFVAAQSWRSWKLSLGVVLMLFFAGGCYSLFRLMAAEKIVGQLALTSAAAV